MQISDEGLLISEGKKQKLIYWDAIAEIDNDDYFLYIYMSSPDAAVDRTISISCNMIEYKISEIENLIKEKKLDNL